MHWELEANLLAMKRAMAIARSEGAALCAFAELAVTGFHRQIVALAKPELIEPAVHELQQLAASLKLAVAFGVPTFSSAGHRFNSHVVLDETGSMALSVAKAGLTEAEATFFAPGTGRGVGRVAGVSCTAVICREVEDHKQIADQLAATAIDLILWPGQMRPDPAKPPADPPEHVAWAQALARATGAFVVQTNWPNALNRPHESENTGHSACVAPTGELLFRLPKEGFGVGVFTLGQRTYSWRPYEA